VAPALSFHVGDAQFYWGNVFSAMIRGSLVHTSTVLIRRTRLDEVGAFDMRFRPSGEDYDFHLRTCHAGPVGFLDIFTARYQIGAQDQLTHPRFGVHFAANYLKAIQPFIEKRRTEILLQPAEINAVLAEAHRWIGEQHFWRNESGPARRHLARSLRHGPGAARAWKLLLASLFPRACLPRRIRRRRLPA
jgi:GT2 family glycosyltransferase